VDNTFLTFFSLTQSITHHSFSQLHERNDLWKKEKNNGGGGGLSTRRSTYGSW